MSENMADNYEQDFSNGNSVLKSYPEKTSRNNGTFSLDFADFQTERAVLATILVEPESLNTVASILGGFNINDNAAGKKNNPESDSYYAAIARVMFRDLKHAAIYEACLELHAKHDTLDIYSVMDLLQRTNKLEVIGGMNYLLELQDSIGSTANLEVWCKILKDYAMLRETIRTCNNALELCKNPHTDIKTLLDNIETSLFNVRNNFVQSEIKDIKQLMKETFQHFMDLLEKKVEPGIPTEYPDLDALIGGGLKKQEMFVLAARPSIGKTALALNIVRNIALKNVAGKPRRKVAFFSLEMSSEQVAQRLLCTESRVPLSSINDGTFKPNEINRLTTAVSTLSAADLYIDPTAGISIYELRAKARKLKETHGIDLIVIDYLQLMKAGEAAKDGRQVEVAAISGGLKKLAKDLDVPVLVLAQLNREVEKGESKKARPKLSNLRESGAIEQDADVVVFLHRNRDEAKESNLEANKAGVKSELIVEKNRNGKTGIVDLLFFPSLMEFRSVDHRYDDADSKSVVSGA